MFKGQIIYGLTQGTLLSDEGDKTPGTPILDKKDFQTRNPEINCYILEESLTRKPGNLPSVSRSQYKSYQNDLFFSMLKNRISVSCTNENSILGIYLGEWIPYHTYELIKVLREDQVIWVLVDSLSSQRQTGS